MSYANLMYTFYYRSPGKEFSWSQKQIKRIDWQNLGTFWIEDLKNLTQTWLQFLRKISFISVDFLHVAGF